MINVHKRVFPFSIESLRPWIESAWSGTDRDVFPRDRISTWRINPPGVGPLELVPQKTRLGHGPMSFVFREWNGVSWRVDVPGSGGKRRGAWHGFDLIDHGDSTELIHTLDLGDARWAERTMFRMLIESLHDWAVESTFDRLEVALRTGAVPTVTERPIPASGRVSWQIMRLLRRAKMKPPSVEGAAAPPTAPSVTLRGNA